MDLRLGLYELAAEHRLDAKACEKLERLAGLHDEPAALSRWLPRGIAVLAAALGGLGIVFWIAANWDTLGRFGRFALLQAVVLVMCAGALWRPAARAPLGLLALLAIGGLFAYFGQVDACADNHNPAPVDVIVKRPCFTPLVLIKVSAIALTVPALPFTTSTSRQLS